MIPESRKPPFYKIEFPQGNGRPAGFVRWKQGNRTIGSKKDWLTTTKWIGYFWG